MRSEDPVDGDGAVGIGVEVGGGNESELLQCEVARITTSNLATETTAVSVFGLSRPGTFVIWR